MTLASGFGAGLMVVFELGAFQSQETVWTVSSLLILNYSYYSNDNTINVNNICICSGIIGIDILIVNIL